MLEHRFLRYGAGVEAYLGVSRPVAKVILSDLHIKPVSGGRYDLRDLWKAVWGIQDRDVPEEGVTSMSAPLLTVADVAEVAGVCERTIRRAGDTRDPSWRLPRHYDFGPRTRRYLGPLVQAWIYKTDPEPWLTPAPRKAILQGGLVVRTTLAPSSDARNGRPAN